MTKHNHHTCECKHEELAYCKPCQTVWCRGCSQEWKPPCTQSHWFSYTSPTYWGTTTRGEGDQIPCDTNSTSDVTIHSGVRHANCG